MILKSEKIHNQEKLILILKNQLETATNELAKLVHTDSQEEIRQKIDSATEQFLAGNVTDGELVFEQLQTRLRNEYGLE